MANRIAAGSPESLCLVWQQGNSFRPGEVRLSHADRRGPPSRQVFLAPAFCLRPAIEKPLPPRQCILPALVALRHLCVAEERSLQRASIGGRDQTHQRSGPSSMEDISAAKNPCAAQSFQRDRSPSTSSHAPSRNPTTGVSFSSRNCRMRSSRVSPMCVDPGSGSR